ncbi:MAG: bifunctional phosphopantothenoylcysteine decarboxylase/phosphopantothenate--cysteine ligase CoaBC [Chlorobia bacterium]|nr:bifunctional phosphopantothenoylcysteine decarboxylase/phosphopantothenate--cysteine ligase CoaBC [Fimbriimonadaceae bacterium]
MPKIVLGVCGSIAAYRAADLARDLMRAGCEVRVCLTDSAQKFVTPILFETLTGNPCLIDTFDEPERGRMAHLDWARQADLLLIAPASANTINKLANGIGEDMLTTIALAFEGPMMLAPAMNPAMYQHPETQASLNNLVEHGATLIEPTEGDVVAGESGQGKLAGNAEIVGTALALLNRSNLLAGKRVLITSGPTQEPIDSVRFLSNRSSGKMGSALAQAALLMGAEVKVIAGPSMAIYPRNAHVIEVRTAEEMHKAALAELSSCDLAIGAAAVADYRPSNPQEGKIRRSDDAISLDLVPNPDIIAELAKSGKRTVGFAAEPSTDLTVAIAKIQRKGLYAIAHNDVSNRGIGFESDKNQITLIRADGVQETSPLASKLLVALWLLERIAE